MRPTVILLGLALVLGASGCAGAGTPADDEGRIGFERNSEFAGPELRVFLTLRDGRRVSVNTTGPGSIRRPDEVANSAARRPKLTWCKLCISYHGRGLDQVD